VGFRADYSSIITDELDHAPITLHSLVMLWDLVPITLHSSLML
jgi:hypothetical protein